MQAKFLRNSELAANLHETLLIRFPDRDRGEQLFHASLRHEILIHSQAFHVVERIGGLGLGSGAYRLERRLGPGGRLGLVDGFDFGFLLRRHLPSPFFNGKAEAGRKKRVVT